jgi:hypothetical protein
VWVGDWRSTGHGRTGIDGKKEMEWNESVKDRLLTADLIGDYD